MKSLCGDNDMRWRSVKRAAEESLMARIKLCRMIAGALTSARSVVVPTPRENPLSRGVIGASAGSLPSERADVLDDGPPVGLGQVQGTAQAHSGRPSSADGGGTTARGHSASPGTTLRGSRGHRDHRRLHEAPRRLSRGFYRAFAPCTIRGGAGKGPVGADDPASTGLVQVLVIKSLKRVSWQTGTNRDRG